MACIHPGWDVLRGREEVIASWRAILGSGAPPVRCVRASASVLGDSAFVVCSEAIEGSELVATNVFVREDGRWAMIHHHGSHLIARPGAADDDSDDEDDDEPKPELGPN